MRKFASTIVGIAIMTNIASVAKAACTCGPDFCQDDPRVPATLAKKKRDLSAGGYPDRLVALIGRGDQCVARITRSPDAFTLWLIGSDGSKRSVPWSQEDEDRASKKVKSGELKWFWIFNTQHAFSCCGQPNYNQRPDYDGVDDVSASIAIKCGAAPCWIVGSGGLHDQVLKIRWDQSQIVSIRSYPGGASQRRT
jgi:hypothetical protein